MDTFEFSCTIIFLIFFFLSWWYRETVTPGHSLALIVSQTTNGVTSIFSILVPLFCYSALFQASELENGLVTY